MVMGDDVENEITKKMPHVSHHYMKTVVADLVVKIHLILYFHLEKYCFLKAEIWQGDRE